MWRALYTFVLRAGAPIILLRLWWRGRREPGYRRNIGERFGIYGDEPQRLRPVLWLHAVSVGEARGSAALVRSLAAAYADHELVLTCMTAAGRETLKELHVEAVRIAWLPYDYPGAVRRFLAHYRPRLGVLMETEIWPNLLAACVRHGVPMLLANARLSEKSALGYRRWSALARPAFASLAAVCAQSEGDAQRLRTLGVRRAEVAGNLKFESTPEEAKRAEGRAWRERLGRPVLLLASTREGEEKMLLEAMPAWDEKLLVLIVPRHPRRFDEVAALSVKDGFPVARRSGGDLPGPQHRVYLGDTMGEMDFYTAAADVAVIGGSFVPRGGQNLIEACAAGVPVVLGPSMFNFTEAARLALDAGAAVQVADAAGAIREALRLLLSAAEREKMGAAGKQLCDAHRGATLKHLQVCRELLTAAARG
ncbi:MAG: 3-deoxy-D-manno-octulosonic acid transferase [Betaproteobacteria bacterium]|nr:3-deoxy-D-manno-octulosonic acid transferase [Betaproteobacteria bacterium]MSQ87887.1 3-deoxy-D-manno-octulosonic acid transferase [Betaproteobacteria bacterium]